MKVGAGSFSLTHLATVFVPGTITFAAVALAIRPSRLLAVTTDWPEWLIGFALLFAVVLLGMIIGSINGVLEANVLDPRSNRGLDIRKDIYDHQWYAYLASLPKRRNPYITKLADFFQFESRTAISLLLLAIGVTIHGLLEPVAAHWPLLLLLATYGMYCLGRESHYELARYRHHMYRFHMEVAGCDLTPVPGLAQWDGSRSHGTPSELLRSMWDRLKSIL